MDIGFDPNPEREPDADASRISFNEMVRKLKDKVAQHDWDPSYGFADLPVVIQLWRDLEGEIAIHVDGETFYISPTEG